MIEHLIKEATCRVDCDTESGTGWLIGKDRIITARHCLIPSIDEGKPIELFFPNSGNVAVAGKIVAHSEDWDACILSMDAVSTAEPLPVRLDMPRQGEAWQTFGYPGSKSTIGHRLVGTVAQTLDTPKLKIDIDLSIDPSTKLLAYEGISGGAMICDGAVVGIISKEFDGTVAALSLRTLEDFFTRNGVVLPCNTSNLSSPALADRGDFPESFAIALEERSGSYLFLEGAHGYGKSTFCRNFQADDKKFVCLGAYCLSDPESSLGADYRAQPQVFLEWFTTKVSGLITGQPPQKEERPYHEQIKKTAEYLDALSNYCRKSGRQGVIFLDGLNEVPEGVLLNELLGLLPAKLPSHVSVVLTAPNFANTEAPLSGKVKQDDVFELPPIPDSACYQYCLEVLNPERRSPALVNLICEKANGHPLYLRYLIEFANLRAEDDELEDFPVLTGPIEEYYQGIWAKLLVDSDAVNLLALMARFRWGVSRTDFAKVLNEREQAQFISVISRVGHLLADNENTTIYHASFAAFIVEKTEAIEGTVNARLAKFCCDEPLIRYCALNRIFHLSLAGDTDVFTECNQAWFDTAVTLGVEPDALIADVDAAVKRAALEASPDDFFRVTLLAQRISFRYDTLFAQSARLIAQALIVLDRPTEALQHVVRLKTLIVEPVDALEIAFLLHRHGYDGEALALLERIELGIIERYQPPIELRDFLTLCSFHIQTHFQIRLAINGSGMEKFYRIIEMARDACNEFFADAPEKLDECIQPLVAESPTYFLSFRDEYANLSRIKESLGDEADLSRLLPSLCLGLLKFEATVENYHLSKDRKSLSQFFSDLAELLPTAEINPPLADGVSDTLIRFGADANIVKQFAAKGSKQTPRQVQLKAENGVDVNHKDLQECLCDWRVMAFLDPAFEEPSSGNVEGADWFESIRHLIVSLYCCDGRTRRAKTDSDEMQRASCLMQLEAQVLAPLRFTLEQRAAWKDSYAIPENALPKVYRQLAELISDCFPEELPRWLDSLVSSAGGQWGMYSEGFRASAFQILKQLTREKTENVLALKLLRLLQVLRDHLLRGVENRHELVPEILQMIPIFADLGAKEEAERLYQKLLSVSMGPTWYKEDQLGIMTEVLSSLAVDVDLANRIPQIAGYLERASGEMTFQRYIRAEKSMLIGQIARHGRYGAAIGYFERQCCGSTEELWAEANFGPIDKVGPLRGSRFPGGAIDDQDAILELVRHSEAASWTFRWALLEIFHCGDSRYVSNYAAAFASIANEAGGLPELVQRIGIVVNSETPSDEKSIFASAFRHELKQELHVAFAAVLVGLTPIKPVEPIKPVAEVGEDEDFDDDLSESGFFGREEALRDGDQILKEAELQLTLGNSREAKSQAAKVLKTAQEGGWLIWGNLSDSARRAEEIIAKDESSAADVIRYYAPLIEAERNVHQWIPARHLIDKVGPLLDEVEGQKLLDTVISHVRLVVGDATPEIQKFEFLDDDTELSPNLEFYRFIVWLCDHPQWLRRERAAAMLLWLVEQVPDLFSEALSTAFSMDEGYGPDVLCGVFDGISARDPTTTWERITNVLDLTTVTEQLRHVSRMAVLMRLAERAEKAGMSSAKVAMNLIAASFSGKRGAGESPEFPIWASSLAPEWRRIVKLLDSESVAAWQKELEQICSPLGVTDGLMLETAVATSFREGQNRPLSRWESKLRYSLNLALWKYVSKGGARELEAALRPYNPSQPECMVQGVSNPVTDQLITAIKSDDYSAVLGSNATVLLNYHDMAVKPNEDGTLHVEVLCLLQPNSVQRGSFGPQLDQSFRSSELPNASTVRTLFEICSRLKPEIVFFGSFTPAAPLPYIQNLIGAKDDDFTRKNWRYSRRNNVRGFGQPERGGCSLSVPREALKIPAGLKLVWIIWLDNELLTVVDERNDRLV